MYAESAALSQSLNLDDDTARTLQWWGHSRLKLETTARAVMRLIDAMPLAGEELAM